MQLLPVPEMVAPSAESTAGLNKLHVHPSQIKTFWSHLYHLIFVYAEFNWILTVSMRHSPHLSLPSGNKKVNHTHSSVPGMGHQLSFAFLCLHAPAGLTKALANDTVKLRTTHTACSPLAIVESYFHSGQMGFLDLILEWEEGAVEPLFPPDVGNTINSYKQNYTPSPLSQEIQSLASHLRCHS